ncbi:pentapeptide repeat-containing protein [Roseobacteraceae bacterium NS-SX3]
MSDQDWIDEINNWKLVRFLKAIAPIGVALTLVGVLFGAYNIWIASHAARDAKLDRSVEIFLSAQPNDRRLAQALNHLVFEDYALGPLDMPATSDESPYYMATIDFSGQQFSGSDLSGNDLRFANFDSSDLYGARFVGAQLTWANFHNARLHDADMENANLACADLRSANMQGTNFSGVDFGHPLGCQAKFTEDELSAAFYFSDNPPVGLSREQISILQVCDSAHRRHRETSADGYENRASDCFLQGGGNSYPPRQGLRLWTLLKRALGS